MTKVGFASCDWSRSVFDDNGYPVMGGSGWARLGQYESLIPEVSAVGVLVHDPQQEVFGVRDWGGVDHFDLDVIVMQRIMFGDLPPKMRRARAAGQILVNDLDDWYWGLSPQNQAFDASHPKLNPTENISHYKKVLATSDYVTVSTAYLAERIQKWVTCPIEILPNTVDLSKFTPSPVRDTTVPIVGWVGSTGHRSGDLAEVRGVLGGLFEEGKIKVHHSGAHENHPSYADEIGMHPKLVTTLPLVAPQHYHKLFVFDVGIVPLSAMPFNRAKSSIKGLEYAAAGVPFIASSSDSYRELRDDGIGMVVRRPYQWRSMIESLRDPNRRAEEVTKNNERLADHDIAHGAIRLKQFFESIT